MLLRNTCFRLVRASGLAAFAALLVCLAASGSPAQDSRSQALAQDRSTPASTSATGGAVTSQTPANGNTGAAQYRLPARPPIRQFSGANPLVLPGQPVTSPKPSKTQRLRPVVDYRNQHTAEPDPAARLPLFGYDFFKPARDLIRQRRIYLQQFYAPHVAPQAQQLGRLPARAHGGAAAGQSARRAARGPNTGLASDESGNGQTDIPADTDQPGRSRNATDGSQPPAAGAGADPSPGRSGHADGSQASDGIGAGANGTGPEVDGTSRAAEDTRDGRPAYEGGSMAGAGSNRPALPQQSSEADAYHQIVDPMSQLFQNVLASVPANYPLAGGDTVTVRFWSPTMETRTTTRTLGDEGAISLPQAGSVVLRGLTLAQAERALKLRLRRYYRDADVSLTLGKMRTIQVLVTGMAFQPGTYTAPAISTAYNVLYAAGGPTTDGSLRDIQVRRNGKLVGVLDVYRYLTVGGQAADIPLQSGDLIYIPPRESRVAVCGEVLQPAIYELKRGETLAAALRFAGGVKPTGVDQSVQIRTLVPGSSRVLKDIDLRTGGGGVSLYDGDVVDIFSVRPLITNQVSVEGAVDQPTSYALTPGMRVSRLVAEARGLLPQAYLQRADLIRTNPDNTTTLIPIDLQAALAGSPSADLALQPWDKLRVYKRDEVAWTGRRELTVRGAVQRPGIYNFSQDMRVSDLLLMAGGPAPDAELDQAVLLHQHGDGSYGLEYVNVASILHGTPGADPLLQDNDVLAVYRVGEAHYEPKHVVTIDGDVVAPGPYPRAEGMKLSDLIRLAGGFKPDASRGVTVAHARQLAGSKSGDLETISVLLSANHVCAPEDDVSLLDGDVVTVQGTGRYQDSVQVVTVSGAVARPGPVILSSRRMRLSDAIQAAGGLLPTAYPAGAEFSRAPALLMTEGQRTMAQTIGQLNDLLNASAYNRERARSYVERLKAVNGAEQSGSLLPGASAPSPTGANSAIAAQLAQEDLVSKPRSLTGNQLQADGSLAVDMTAALRHPGGPDDLVLQDGDAITVPETPTTIQVVGAVFNGRAVLYKPGAPISYYVAQAGGFAPDAAQDRIEIIHLGGGLIPAERVKQLRPGDVVLIPTRVLAAKLASNRSSIDTFFRSLTSSAIIFKVATSVFGL